MQLIEVEAGVAGPRAKLHVRSDPLPRGAGDAEETPPTPAVRTVDAYRGYGAWVDVFDYSPPYAGDSPPVTPADLDRMAADGVETVYLQAGRLSRRSLQGIENPWLLAEFLLGAHERGMAVVAWYLPNWTSDGRDLHRLKLLDEFEVLGHRFDGVAVDIEFTGGGLTPDERNARLLALSRLLADDEPLGAIVMPSALLEVVNPDYWPGFPWRELRSLYDVWLPMSYWSFRSGEYGDGYSYHEDSVRRLRANLGDEDALVHGIGGIGGTDRSPAETASGEPLASLEEIRAFLRALADSESMGGSIYDWVTLAPAARSELAAHFSAG